MVNKFKIINNGVNKINWLLNKYKNKQVTKKSIRELREDLFYEVINKPEINFSTSDVGVAIIDYQTMNTCEIIYVQ